MLGLSYSGSSAIPQERSVIINFNTFSTGDVRSVLVHAVLHRIAGMTLYSAHQICTLAELSVMFTYFVN